VTGPQAPGSTSAAKRPWPARGAGSGAPADWSDPISAEDESRIRMALDMGHPVPGHVVQSLLESREFWLAGPLGRLRDAIVHHALERQKVAEWTREQAAGGTLIRNDQAPSWPEYMTALDARNAALNEVERAHVHSAPEPAHSPPLA